MLDRIVRAAALTPEQHTLEIGAGLGALTRSLADFSVSVTSIEIDRLLEPILYDTVGDRPNVRLIFEDFLKLDLAVLLDEALGSDQDAQITVVANIPYYITTPILERLLEQKRRIRRIVLLVQQEFADRMAAQADSDAYGSMSVYAQYHTKVEKIGSVSRNVFLPPPEVGSAIVALTPVVPGTVAVREEAVFFRLMHAGFGKRRKTLLNALAGGEIGLEKADAERLLHRAGIDPTRRGETLTLEEWAHLANNYTE